jgi:hypothetical protein
MNNTNNYNYFFEIIDDSLEKFKCQKFEYIPEYLCVFEIIKNAINNIEINIIDKQIFSSFGEKIGNDIAPYIFPDFVKFVIYFIDRIIEEKQTIYYLDESAKNSIDSCNYININNCDKPQNKITLSYDVNYKNFMYFRILKFYYKTLKLLSINILFLLCNPLKIEETFDFSSLIDIYYKYHESTKLNISEVSDNYEDSLYLLKKYQTIYKN